MVTYPPATASIVTRLPQSMVMPSKGTLSDAKTSTSFERPCQVADPR